MGKILIPIEHRFTSSGKLCSTLTSLTKPGGHELLNKGSHQSEINAHVQKQIFCSPILIK